MMNILFSTTRQWNPGDEIILHGVLNLMKATVGEFNPIIWNRHPSINPNNMNLDNSFSVLRHDLSAIDYVVIAGSPEWLGGRLHALYKEI